MQTNKEQRILAIGDVHGCLTQLDELLRTLQYNRERDRLIFVGDLMDRGPDGVGVVRRVRELGAECVMGNHDEKHINFRRNEVRKQSEPSFKNKMNFSPERVAENAALTEEEIAWMTGLPLYLDVVVNSITYRIVHAGLAADRPIARQGRSPTRLRYAYTDGRPYEGDNLNPPNEVVRWASVWPGPEHVIYGHAVYDLKEVTIDEPVPGVYCYGIDTGCCFGGHLTAMIVNTLEFVQVGCPTRYSRWHGDDLPAAVMYDKLFR